MTIEYLQILQGHNTMDGFIDKGLTETEINHLEQLYNNNTSFPKILKELLFLAGKSCNFLDYSIYDNQQEMQDEERLELQELHDIIITRPFFIIDLASYGLPLFIFLDEGENPLLNQLEDEPSQSKYYRRTGGTLKDLITSRIQNYLQGFNPF